MQEFIGKCLYSVAGLVSKLEIRDIWFHRFHSNYLLACLCINWRERIIKLSYAKVYVEIRKKISPNLSEKNAEAKKLKHTSDWFFLFYN